MHKLKIKAKQEEKKKNKTTKSIEMNIRKYFLIKLGWKQCLMNELKNSNWIFIDIIMESTICISFEYQYVITNNIAI